MEEVGGGVVAPDGLAAVGVDLGDGRLPGAHEALFHHALVDEEVRGRPTGVLDADGAGLRADGAGVTDLTAGLPIEGGSVQNDLDLLAGFGFLQGTVGADQGDDGGFGPDIVVAEELGAAGAEGGVELGAAAGGVLEGGAAAAGGALGGHGAVEPFLVHGDALLAGQLDREVVGEAEGVVELEGFLARQGRVVVAGETGGEGLEAADAGGEGAAEALLLVGEDALDLGAALAQVRVVVAEGVDDHAGHLGEEGFVEAELAAVADGAAEDATEDVGAAFVAGQDAVGDQEGGAPDVIGDDAEGAVVGRVLPIGDVGQGGGALDDGLVEVRVVDGSGALHDHRQALQAHAGVDVLAGKGRQGAVRPLEELHEDVVPNLQEAAAVVTGAAVGLAAAGLRAPVEVDLGVGAAGAGGADGAPPVVGGVEPAVVLAGDLDLLLRDPDDVLPDGVGGCVLRVDGGNEPLAGDAHGLGQELPGPDEGFPLEVVADGEVAEHEEEGAVALVTDLVDVDGAEALLDGGHPRGGRGFEAQEVGRHLLHAGSGEEDGGVVDGHQG